jgi:ATP-dependent helicase HrpA
MYPALVEHDGRIDLTLLPPGAGAVARHRAGVRRLLVKALPQQAALVRARVLEDRTLLLAYHGIGDNAALVEDVVAASADEVFTLDPPVRTAAEFAARLEEGRGAFVEAADSLRALLHEILPRARALRAALAAARGQAKAAGVRDDLEAQLNALVGPRFLSGTPREWRKHLPRYLSAAELRWQKRGQRHEPDLAAQVHAAAARLEHWCAGLPEGWPLPPAMVEYRWLIEELRVSLFAQQLGTLRPVSAKRLEQVWASALEAA